ncbi:Phosphorylase family protein [Aspergillus niger]|uniref:Phosphorylase family protein n=1 Tax=Aspergillus niger TaxID=5061 RepID=A0A505ILK1_ASPNG|nr:Phosphorylase family protein [Aspergillus niger]
MSTLLFVATASPILYLLYVLLSRWQHAQNARKWNCGSVPSYPGDLLGINTLKEALAMDKARQVPTVTRRRVETMSARENRYTTTFQFRQLGTDVISTCDPKNVQALLATQFKDFELGQSRRNALHWLLGRGIFTADGDHWSRSRALLRPQFTRDQISDLDLEERHVQVAMKAMPVDATGWTPATDIQTIFFRLTMDTATEFLFGESVQSQAAALSNGAIPQDDFPAQFDRGQWYSAQRARFEKLYWIINNKESRAINKAVHAYVDRFVTAALNSDPEKKPTGHYVFLHGLAEATRDPNFLNEVLRLYPIVPGNRRTAVRNTTLPTGGGPAGTDPVYVKKGQPVFYSTYVMHRRPDLWGADADEFRPDRWNERKAGWEYLPFNGGPRICIGQQFALTETGYVLVRLLQRFDVIEGVGKTKEGEINMQMSLTNAPGDNVTVRLHEDASN